LPVSTVRSEDQLKHLAELLENHSSHVLGVVVRFLVDSPEFQAAFENFDQFGCGDYGFAGIVFHSFRFCSKS